MKSRYPPGLISEFERLADSAEIISKRIRSKKRLYLAYVPLNFVLCFGALAAAIPAVQSIKGTWGTVLGFSLTFVLGGFFFMVSWSFLNKANEFYAMRNILNQRSDALPLLLAKVRSGIPYGLYLRSFSAERRLSHRMPASSPEGFPGFEEIHINESENRILADISSAFSFFKLANIRELNASSTYTIWEVDERWWESFSLLASNAVLIVIWSDGADKGGIRRECDFIRSDASLRKKTCAVILETSELYSPEICETDFARWCITHRRRWDGQEMCYETTLPLELREFLALKALEAEGKSVARQ